MIGENKVEMNDSQMCKALETYLKEHEMKKTNFKVTSVEKDKNGFVVKMIETKKQPEAYQDSEESESRR